MNKWLDKFIEEAEREFKEFDVILKTDAPLGSYEAYLRANISYFLRQKIKGAWEDGWEKGLEHGSQTKDR